MNWITRVTIGWAVVFAVVHGYWAAGGEAGMGGEPADELGAQLYIGAITLIGLASAGVAYGLARRPTRALARLARIGGAALLLGVSIGVARWVADGGVGDDGAGGVITTAYFLAGGALFLMLSRPRVSCC